MANPVFRSKLGKDLKVFIMQKRAAGYPYHTSAQVLGYLDIMITEQYPEFESRMRGVNNAILLVEWNSNPTEVVWDY